ncbi:hypothetical protein Tco_1210935 [Tanacetum coccineum]
MSTYLKNMTGYKNNQLKNKSFDDIQELFDKAMKRVNTFVDMETELLEGSEVRAKAEIAQENNSKRAGTKIEQESIKKQKVDEDKETVELQRLIEIVLDKEEVAIDAIPLATKPRSIVNTKDHKEGKKTYYQIIWADGSLKIKKLKNDNKARGGLEDVPMRRSKDNVVHSLRKQNMRIYMLVEKRYPLTAPTITYMLNRKLQADHWNEILFDDLGVTVAKFSSEMQESDKKQGKKDLKWNIMDEVDIEDLTIEQYFRMTQESQKPKKVDDMTIAEYLGDEEAMKTQDYNEYQPNSTKADVLTIYKDHLSPHHKSPVSPLDTKTNPYHQASQSPVHPKITKTTTKYTREIEEQSNQGLGDWLNEIRDAKARKFTKRDDSHSNLRRQAKDDALRKWEAQIDQLRREE